MLGEDLRDSFQFDDQRTVHDEIWDVVLLEPPALVEARQFRFRVKGNGADLKFNFACILGRSPRLSPSHGCYTPRTLLPSVYSLRLYNYKPPVSSLLQTVYL